MRIATYLILGLIMVGGCGTSMVGVDVPATSEVAPADTEAPPSDNEANPSGAEVSLEQAIATCEEWRPLGVFGVRFDRYVLGVQGSRELGRTEAEFLGPALRLCEADESRDPGFDLDGCLACFTQIGAAVWD